MKSNFGRNLGLFLDFFDLSQAEFAKRTGLTQAAVSQIVNGKREPGLETICRVLKVIPVTFERLIEDPIENEVQIVEGC
jgi:transcriptional regulator with XRE-family HTH domain